MKQIVTIIALFFSTLSLLNAKITVTEQDTVVVKAIDVYIDYCISNDSKIAWAEERNIPIVYTTLIINGITIRDSDMIDLIRRNIDGKRLGPYHIKRIKRYTQSQLQKKGLQSIPQYGGVELVLRRGEVFDFYSIQ